VLKSTSGIADEISANSRVLVARLASLIQEHNAQTVKTVEKNIEEVRRIASEQNLAAEQALIHAAQTIEDLELALADADEKINDAVAEAARLREKLPNTQQETDSGLDG